MEARMGGAFAGTEHLTVTGRRLHLQWCSERLSHVHMFLFLCDLLLFPFVEAIYSMLNSKRVCWSCKKYPVFEALSDDLFHFNE